MKYAGTVDALVGIIEEMEQAVWAEWNMQEQWIYLDEIIEEMEQAASAD